MMIGYTTNAPALAPLARALDGFLMTSNEVADHFRWTADYMSALRKSGKGPPWFALPTGAVRYRMDEVFSWQMASERGPLTLERVALAVAACEAVPAEHKAAMIAHLERTFQPGAT